MNLPDAADLLGMDPSRQRHYRMLILREERDQALGDLAVLRRAVGEHAASTPGNRRRAADRTLYSFMEEGAEPM